MYTKQSFPGLGDDYIVTCFAQSMMLNERYGTLTLSDFNTAITLKPMNHFNEDPVYCGDLQHIDKSNNEIKIIGDGACPPSLAGEIMPAKFAEHGIETEGDAGGFTVEFVCKAAKGVLARVGHNNGEFEMLLTHCTFTEPSKEELKKRRLECGIPFWEHAFMTAECDIEKLLESFKNEYEVLGYRSIFTNLL